MSRDAALRALSVPGTLAVMPSHDENSPCAVVECQMAGILFIAADVGGVAELIAPQDREKVLFAPSAIALAERLEVIWNDGHPAVHPHPKPAEIASVWRAFHDHLGAEHPPQFPAAMAAVENLPLVSICITHYRRPHLLTGLIEAIEAQTYPNLEIILVDDGSDEAVSDAVLDALERGASNRAIPMRVQWIENSYLGVARNAAAKIA